MRARLEPYRYESNGNTLLWLSGFLAIWMALSLALAYSDNDTASYLQELSDGGLTYTPPGDVYPETIVAYSKKEGLNCDDSEALLQLTPPCERVVEIQKSFNSRKDRGNFMFAGIVLLLIIISFPFSTFIHRASRNLPTLKSSGQKFSPDGAVIWFFVPLVNIVRPAQAVFEIFKASEPEASANDREDWKRTGKVHPIAYLWAIAFGAAALFNPVTVQRIFFRPGDTIEGAVSTLQTAVWADFVLAAVALAAILMTVVLHQRQEARRAKVGDYVYTPPPPEPDLLQQAREERKSRRVPRLEGRVGTGSESERTDDGDGQEPPPSRKN